LRRMILVPNDNYSRKRNQLVYMEPPRIQDLTEL